MIGGLLKSTASRLALVAAAGLFVGSMAVPSAKAADLGGDCCADLEERVAELEATTARKGNRKMSLTVSGQVNRAMMYYNDGSKSDILGVDNGTQRSGFNFTGSAKINPNISAGFDIVVAVGRGARSQHVNQLDDDGNAQASGTTGLSSTNTQAVDADPFSLAVEQYAWWLDDKTLGRITVGRTNTAQSNTFNLDLGGYGAAANTNIGLWNQSFILRREGAAPASTNGLAVSSASYVAWTNLQGGSAVDIASSSRGDGIRYDTPAIGGFIASAFFGEENFYDVSLKYAGEFSGFRLAAAASYSWNRDRESDPFVTQNCALAAAGNVTPACTTSAVGGAGQSKAGATGGIVNDNPDIQKLQTSASLLHVGSGLFVNGGYLRQSYNGQTPSELVAGTFIAPGTTAGSSYGAVTAATLQRPDTTFWHVSGGISKNFFGIGNTVPYAEYGVIKDGGTGTAASTLVNGTAAGGATWIFTDTEVKYFGLGIVQNIDAAAMELYLSYRNYSADVKAFSLGVAPACAATGTCVIGAGTKLGLEDLQIVMAGARIRF